MIYLASPYSARPTYGYACARHAAYQLHRHGHHVFSPILHWHHVATHFMLRGDHEYWLEYNIQMMKLCDDMIVLAVSGWDISFGVTVERHWWEDNKSKPYVIHTVEELADGRYNPNR